MCTKSVTGQKGQAIIEYVFLLFFTVLLFSGFIYQFNGAVKDYFDSYFSADGYIACLIEKGILPGEESEEGGCETRAFNINNGKKLAVKGMEWSSGGSSSAASHDGKNRTVASDGAGSRRVSEAGDGRTVPGGASRGATAGVHSSKPQTPGVTKLGQKNGGGTGNAGFSNHETGDLNEGGGDAGSRSGTVATEASSNRYGSVSKRNTVPATDRDLKSPRTIAEEKSKKKAEALKAQGLDFSLGNIFKYLVLILLLFAIIFFIGSQVVAVSRGKKKRT